MSVVENDEIRHRGRGRPPIRSDEATLRLILDAASEEFRAEGYAATGIAAVARRAGVSTRTLYRLVPTKAELFRQVIRRRIGDFVLAMDALETGVDDVAAGLERLLIAYATFSLGPEVVAVHRLVLGECGHFPELGQAFYEGAVQKAGHLIAVWLQRQCRRGLIKLDDTRLAADMLRGMMILEPQRAAMLGQAEAPDAAQITRRAKACAKLFLEGCLV